MKRPRISSLKKNLLALLLCALMLPPVGVLLVAAFAHLTQEKAMEAAVNSYVRDLAESVAYRLSIDVNLFDLQNYNFPIAAYLYNVFALGPSIPGWVAYLSGEGQIIMSSPGAEVIPEIWNKELTVGEPIRTRDGEGRQYTIAAYPIQDGGYVVAAVSWDGLLGNLVRVGRLWPILIVVFASCSLFATRLLWRCLIAPLKDLVAEIDGFRAGKSLPGKADPNAVREIERLYNAMSRFAQAVIERDNLRNRYVRDIVQVQETERMDMAREIHDGPLQDITALLQQIHIAIDDGIYSHERVKKVERLAKVVVRELRGLCDELSPPWVDLGFSQAITELAERLSSNYDIRISVDADDSFEFAAEQTLSLLRIFQEAVSNAARHGNATEIHAGIRKENGRHIFEIKDNGGGFDAEFDHQTLRLEGHRGLANMTERMSLMGGTFEVRSAKGEGTVIICSWT